MARPGKTETLTADAVAELFAQPARAQRAAEAQAAAEALAPADARLREALAARLAVLEPMQAEVVAWFARRPLVVQATYEETLGDGAREKIDRVVLLGVELSNITSGPAPAAARRALDRLADPADDAARGTALACLRDLEGLEGIARHRLTAWRTLRAHTVEQLTKAIATTREQIGWLEADHV